MNKPLLSVVVPVYNKENYLRESLYSLINQTFKDTEIICINDGSSDNSLDVLYEIQAQCERIKIITQENKGASAARNEGIRSANGKYLMFW